VVAAKREESLKVPRSTVEHREAKMRALQDFIRELFQGCKVYVFAFGCWGIRGRKNSVEELLTTFREDIAGVRFQSIVVVRQNHFKIFEFRYLLSLPSIGIFR